MMSNEFKVILKEITSELVINKNYGGHHIEKGDVILFASVGAGMNINAVTYQL